MNTDKYQVPSDKLRWECDPKLFEFECTKDLAPLREFIGQDRAIRAIEFGLDMNNGGYNIYVAGLSGTGKTSIVKHYIEKIIAEKKEKGETFPLEDWCYLYNFKDTDRPQIVNLPKGKGKGFKNQVAQLLDRVKEDLSGAFTSEEYNKQRKKAVEEAQAEQKRFFDEMSQQAREQGFALQMSPSGPMLIPMVEGRPMEEKEYYELDEQTRKDMENRQGEVRKMLQSRFEEAAKAQQERLEKLQQSDKDVGEFTITRIFEPLFDEYKELPRVQHFLTDLKTYTVDNLGIFKGEASEETNPTLGVPMSQVMGGRDPFIPFQVNVFVDNSELENPPVVTEPHPNFGNVFGKIERRFVFGGYLSDHTMLKAGALNQANGGYLVLSVQDVLTNTGVWPALKRAIKNLEVRIEDPFEQFGLIAPQGMKPEPMPIHVKVILIGDSNVYHLLSTYDEDFWEIFKVKADFNYQIEKTDKNILDYAAFISGCCEECKVRHFDAAGVAKAIEYSARMVADQEHLSTRFAQMKELIEEANYWAEREKSKYISDSHILQAIKERRFRHNLVEERLGEMINEGTIMIDVDGAVEGQVNGLSVYTMGDITFGKPSRITARTFMGRAGIINIERETQMSGPIHNKGVLILSGYLGWKYAQDRPLALSASLCFEQSYEGVEGDSASSTELYAILSSLSEVPIKQNIAVTGSVNQKGEIQPIGGVNQKIEGFFDVCQAKGLTGEQGVMIPHQNVRNLMLRENVVEAIKNGKFHIWSVKTIDEGIEVLTGKPAGKRRKDGSWPKGSINYLVDQKLQGMAEKLRGFMAEEKKGNNKDEGK